MSKVYVFARDLLRDEIEAIVSDIEAAGILPDRIELVEEVSSPNEGCEEDVFIFLLTPATIAGVDAQEAISKVPDGGRRAICIWPEGTPADTFVPPAMEKYSYSTLTWNSPRFGPVVAEVDTTYFETPAGERVMPPDDERNECE